MASVTVQESGATVTEAAWEACEPVPMPHAIAESESQADARAAVAPSLEAPLSSAFPKRDPTTTTRSLPRVAAFDGKAEESPTLTSGYHEGDVQVPGSCPAVSTTLLCTWAATLPAWHATEVCDVHSVTWPLEPLIRSHALQSGSPKPSPDTETCSVSPLDSAQTAWTTGLSYDTAADSESMAVPTVTAAGRVDSKPREICPETAESDVQSVCSAPDAPKRTATEEAAMPMSKPSTVRTLPRSAAALAGVTAEIGPSNVNACDTVPTRTPEVTTADRSAGAGAMNEA
eukprot:209927-Rhodomonas_salina.1